MPKEKQNSGEGDPLSWKMSLVSYLIIMLFAVFTPSLSTRNPNSETKENNIETSVQLSTEERMKARLEELGIAEGVFFT